MLERQPAWQQHLMTLWLLMGLLFVAACGDNVVVGDTPGNSASPPGNSSSPTTPGQPGTGTPPGNNPPPADEPGNDAQIPDTSGSASLDPADIVAARFLTQATFGPTTASIAEFRASGGPEAWLNAQQVLPASTITPYTRQNSNGSSRPARHEAWWNNALSAPDQLRQRVAFALSQIFVVSDLDYALGNAQYGMADYYDMLTRHAFGNYRELLGEITLHPVMGVYLSMVRNEKADAARNIRPDENYAREVLQLFSIGLHELTPGAEPVPSGNPNPAYTQQTVEEFARVFTGWNYGTASSWTTTSLGLETYTTPMVPVEEFHDAGTKTLLNNAIAPAGLSARDDLNAALDNIFQHPNVGPFISKQLIQRLVTSDPTPDYVARVSSIFNNNGAGVRGDLGAVVRAILLDDEARNGHQRDANFGKIREPLVRLAHFWRAMSATPGPQSEGVHRTANFPLYRLDEMSGQAVMKSKSVFNFYLPDNPIVPGGDRLSPEMQIMTEANIAAAHNNYHHQMYRFHNRADLSDDNPRVTIIDLDGLAGMAINPDALLDWYNLIFFAGGMPDYLRDALAAYMRNLDNSDAGRFAKVQDTLFIVLSSPPFHLQR